MGLTANMDGYLLKQFGDVKEPYTNEEIAKITMHDLSIVEKGVNLLEKVGLLEKIDNAYFIEEALNMTNQTIGAREKQEQRRNSFLEQKQQATKEEFMEKWEQKED